MTCLRPKYTLTYFNFRWLAEPTRFLLRYIGVDFEDVRKSWEEWEKTPLEEHKKKYRYAKLPLLTERDENGEVVMELSQSFAITRYLSKKYNMAGSNAMEEAKCDEYIDCLKDILKELENMWCDDEKQKLEIRTNLLEKTIPRYFSVIEEDLSEQRQKHNKLDKIEEFFPLVGNAVTWADFMLAHYTAEFENFLKINAGDEIATKLLHDYPTIKAHQKGVFALEPIKNWIKQRPATQY